MEIQNANTTPIKSNQLKNVNNVRWESRHITTRPGEIDDRKSEVIAFVVNACMNIIANNCYIFRSKFLCLKYLLCSVGYISGICFSNSGLSIVDISSRYQEVSLNMSIRSYFWNC